MDSFTATTVTLVTQNHYLLKNTHDLKTRDVIKVVGTINSGQPVVQLFRDYAQYVETRIKKEETFFTLDPYFVNSFKLETGATYEVGEFIDGSCERSLKKVNYFLTGDVTIR